MKNMQFLSQKQWKEILYLRHISLSNQQTMQLTTQYIVSSIPIQTKPNLFHYETIVRAVVILAPESDQEPLRHLVSYCPLSCYYSSFPSISRETARKKRGQFKKKALVSVLRREISHSWQIEMLSRNRRPIRIDAAIEVIIICKNRLDGCSAERLARPSNERICLSWVALEQMIRQTCSITSRVFLVHVLVRFARTVVQLLGWETRPVTPRGIRQRNSSRGVDVDFEYVSRFIFFVI